MKVLVWLLTGACLLTLPAAAHAAFPGENGRLVFTRMQPSGATDLYSVEPDGQAEVRLTEDGISGNGAFSPDGTQLAYSSGSRIYIADQYANDPQLVRDTGTYVGEIDWSPDGTQLVVALANCAEFDCETDIYVLGVDGTGLTNLTNSLFSEQSPSWSPDGSRITFDSTLAGEQDVFTIDPDGSDLANLTDDTADPAKEPDWSPDASQIAFESNGSIRTMNADGSGKATYSLGVAPVWSPDGTTINGGRNTDWQVEPPVAEPSLGGGYPRAKGATPVYVPLVVAYQKCPTNPPNRMHGPPLAYPSCAPPHRASSNVMTVGTPDANGLPVEAEGFVRLDTVLGNPITPEDEADVRIRVQQTDVRYNPSLVDYPGELIAHLGIRSTDRFNAGGPTGAGTVVDFTVRVTVPCAATAGEPGGACAVDTTADAVIPGLVRESERTNWEVGQVRVFWEGADGAPQTNDDLLFATQGVFVP